MTKLFLTAAVIACIPAMASADPVTLKDMVPHITTTGSASADVVPDLADLKLGVRNERPTASEAAAVTAKAASDVIADVKAHGIDSKDIKTTFDISAQYDVKTDGHGTITERTLRGYSADEGIIVRVRDVSKAGALARELIEKGVNAFEGIDFSYSKEKEKRRDLDAAAIRDALTEAKIYTDAIGLELGRVLQIGDETMAGGEADLPSRRMPPGYSVAIPTEPGVQKLREAVTVIWEIVGKAH